jgi:hypothetical protein
VYANPLAAKASGNSLHGTLSTQGLWRRVVPIKQRFCQAFFENISKAFAFQTVGFNPQEVGWFLAVLALAYPDQ